MILWGLSFIPLIWLVTLIDFGMLILNQSYVSWINLFWLWCIIFFICCWVWFCGRTNLLSTCYLPSSLQGLTHLIFRACETGSIIIPHIIKPGSRKVRILIIIYHHTKPPLVNNLMVDMRWFSADTHTCVCVHCFCFLKIVFFCLLGSLLVMVIYKASFYNIFIK